VINRKIRLAWVSTYNSRCGLATHSEHLLEHFDRRYYDITVIGNHAEPVKPDPANLVRLWPDRSGSLASVRDFIRRFDAVFVNFHFSLMELHDLEEMLKAAQLAGIDTYVALHKTLETVIDGQAVSLGAIADVLRGCTRLIVHTEADIARLRTFAVVDNVVMIPPGVVDRPALNAAVARRRLNLQQFHPIVGTFGFLLPPKGLPQLIDAFTAVLRHYPKAMLLMLSAEYPAVESAQERNRCQALIRELCLEDRVMLIDEFLETEEILSLLNACDLTVFPYQHSDESDSGAVRLGLAAGRPVATTPLPIFANLAGVVQQFSGVTAADIAAGIVALLRDPALCAAIVERQQGWISRYSWSAQAARVSDIIRGCFAGRHTVEWLPAMTAGGAGERRHAGICAKPGTAGHLVYGPYVKLGAGDYRVRVRWDAGQPTQDVPRGRPAATIEAVSGYGNTYLAQRQLRVEDCLRPEHELRFRIDRRLPPALPVEVRVWTSGAVPLTVNSITVEPIAGPARMPAARAPATADVAHAVTPEYRPPSPVLAAHRPRSAAVGLTHLTAPEIAAFDR
jgi:glycosyltransferase involved in cell wall biosynthesis